MHENLDGLFDPVCALMYALLHFGLHKPPGITFLLTRLSKEPPGCVFKVQLNNKWICI